MLTLSPIPPTSDDVPGRSYALTRWAHGLQQILQAYSPAILSEAMNSASDRAPRIGYLRGDNTDCLSECRVTASQGKGARHAGRT